MTDTIGTAYVQIEPSFDGVVPKIDKEFGGAGESSGKSFGQGFAKVAGGVGKVALAAVGTASAAIGAFGKQAVESFADYEQLVGGVQTLFGLGGQSLKEYAAEQGKTIEEVQDKWMELTAGERFVLNNADEAYRTAGLSANEYMETVTGFAAALTNSLNGDTKAAAQAADMAITDMSDNANKMGTSMESLQNAYSGFSKQNFTMLDNLKLGYGGTKEEMSRLLEDAEKLPAAMGKEFDLNNYADVVEAIHLIQDNMGITGTTAREAGTTISGSIGMAKAAWENLANTIADPDGDIGTAIDNMLTSIVGDGTDSNKGVLGNLMPIIEQSLQGIGQFIEEAAPIITEQLPALVDALLPPLLEAATSIVDGLVSALPSILQTLVSMLPGIIDTICQTLISNLPLLTDVALQAILTLASGIAQSLPTLIPQIVDIVIQIVNTLLDNIDMLVDVAIDLIMALTEGLIEAQPMLIEKMPELISKLVVAIVTNLPKIAQAGVELILTLIDSFVSMFGQIFDVGSKIVDEIKNGFSNKVGDAKTWGKDLIDNFINGIKEKWEHLKQTVSQVAESIKSYLGFSEPEEGPLSNFHTYAPDMMDLFSKGIKANSYKVTDALAGVGSDMMDTNVNVNHMVSSDFATSNNDNTVSIGGDVAAAVRDALIGMGIYMDSKQVGAMVAQPVNNALGRIAIRGAVR